MTFLELHGDRVAYRDADEGEVLLLIHGIAGSAETWRCVIPRLSKTYRVIAPDLLGHGASAKPRGDYSLGAFAVWLRDFLDELGVGDGVCARSYRSWRSGAIGTASFPSTHAYAAHEARTDSRLEVLPHVGHFPQVEAPTEVVELIEDFILTGDRRDMDSPQQRRLLEEPAGHKCE